MTTALKQLHLAVGGISGKLQKKAASFLSIDQLREAANACAEDVRGQILDFAKVANRGPMFVVRNLIATCPVEILPRLHDLLLLWKTKTPFEPADEHRELIKAMHGCRRSGDLFRWLVLGGRAPSMGLMASFFRGKLPALLAFEREAMRDSKSRKPSDTLKLIKAFFVNSRSGYSDLERNILLTEGFAKGLPQLDEPSFKKLSSAAKRWLLADPKYSRVALTPELHTRIWSNPLAFKDTPEAIRIQTWAHKTLPSACRCLRERDFESHDLQVLLNRSDIGDYSDLILESLGKRRGASSRMTRDASLDLPKGVLGLLGKRTANALNFFSKPLEHRLSFVRSLDQEVAEQISFDVSSVDWLDAVRMSESRAALKAFRERILNDPPLRRKLFQDLINGETSGVFFSYFVPDLMRDADAAVLKRLVSKRTRAFAVWKPAFLSRPAFREVLQGYCLTTAGAFSLLRHAPKEVIEKLFKSDEKWIREWRHALASQASRSRSRNLRRDVRSLLVRFCPGLIGETIGWKISRSDFDRLFSDVFSVKRGSGCGAIFNFVEPRGQACWVRYLRKPKNARMLRPLIRRERPDLVPRLNVVDSAILLGDPQFRTKLTGILEGTETEVPLGVSRPVLREMIPWVRKTWRKKPTLAVAFELALAFSLRDSRYLVSLCAARWKSGDKDRGGHAFDHLYRTHSLPKKSGGSRLVTVPDAPLRRLQRRILRNGFDDVFIHPSAHGFKSGCSILTNATPHVGKACVVNVDIESFFPSTRYPLILRACSLLLDGQLSEGACHVVADICSFDGGLPTGAPTSPAIANLVLRSADAAINKAAMNNGITYTRYADDLTFSGDTNTLKILPFVKRVLTQLGYQLKEKKTNIFRRGRRQMVTGLVVNEKPNLSRRLRRRLRAAVHQSTMGADPHWQGQPMSSHELLGRLAFLNLVQPAEAMALKQKMTGSAQTLPPQE